MLRAAQRAFFACITLACLTPLAQAQPDVAQAAAAKPCAKAGAWYIASTAGLNPAPARELLETVSRRDIVLLGEQHDNAAHHQWQLQTLAALHLLRPDMVIGFEAFPRRMQGVLDRWVAGALTERELLEQSEWGRVWRFPAELYLPLFRFARMNRIPMIALNVERALTEAVRRHGWEAVPIEQKEGVSRPAPASRRYRDYLFEVFKQHAPQPDKTAPSPEDPAFGYFVESQITWDRAMAEALAARRLQNEAPPLVVGIVGSGHLRDGDGVPHQLRDLGVTNIATLLSVDPHDNCDEIRRTVADAIFVLPDVPPEAPRVRLGVRLTLSPEGVRITEIVPGSLAEASGLQRGDRIVSIAGTRVSRTGAVVSALRAQPPGTWLPLDVQRGDKTLQFVVKFPAQ